MRGLFTRWYFECLPKSIYVYHNNKDLQLSSYKFKPQVRYYVLLEMSASGIDFQKITRSNRIEWTIFG